MSEPIPALTGAALKRARQVMRTAEAKSRAFDYKKSLFRSAQALRRERLKIEAHIKKCKEFEARCSATLKEIEETLESI